MPSPPSAYARYTREAVFAVFAGCGAYFLSSLSFGLYASSVTDSFVSIDTAAGILVPFAIIDLASGFLAGLVLSAATIFITLRK